MVLRTEFERFLKDNDLPSSMVDELARVYLPLTDFLTASPYRLIGINGSQGSGKSTLCQVLAWLLERRGKRVAVLSIDDLYLSRARRMTIAEQVHPLLRTRGVPGTHHVEMGIETLETLLQGKQTALPRFNKAEDDPYPASHWPVVTGFVDFILFEGWCVASRPQTEIVLAKPINRLEAEEDRDGNWRGYANRQLAGPYQRLFGLIDCLILLEAESFSWVYAWRKKQEAHLRRREAGNGIMDDVAIERFVQHFERITRHNWKVLPKYAHVRLTLDRDQRVGAIMMDKMGNSKVTE